MIVFSKVVRDREKALVFCQTPASTLLIYAALKLINIDVVLLAAHQPIASVDALSTNLILIVRGKWYWLPFTPWRLPA